MRFLKKSRGIKEIPRWWETKECKNVLESQQKFKMTLVILTYQAGAQRYMKLHFTLLKSPPAKANSWYQILNVQSPLSFGGS